MNQTNGPHSTGVDNTFSSAQSNAQTNPFTADLRGEFTSNFGTNTNAVSQIFKDGGFASSNRGKYIGIGVGVLVVLLVIFFLTRSGSHDDPFLDEMDPLAGPVETPFEKDAVGLDGEGALTGAEGTAALEADYYAEAAPVAHAETAYATGPISLVTPANGQSWSYDETMGPAPFEWQGGGGYIIFARNSSMQPEVMRVPVSGNSYNFHNPYPGTWYWRVENAEGASEVSTFHVSEPVRRNIAIQLPASGGALAANGGVVEWAVDSRVAFYRVEFATGSFTNPQYRFATSGNKVQVEGMTAGQYQMRVGAFSEVAGRWEYTQPITVSVQ